MLKTLILPLCLCLIFSTLSCQENSQAKSTKKAIQLTLGLNVPITSVIGQQLQSWQQLIFQKSEGKIEVQIFDRQQLGTDQQMVEKVLRGELDMSLPPISKLSYLNPRIGLFDLPYLFNNKYDVQAGMKGPLGEYLKEELNKQNIDVLGHLISGMKYITSNVPLDSSDQITIRTMKNPLIKSYHQSLGHQTRQIDFLQIKNALKDQIINAQENPITSIQALSLRDNQQYIYNSKHSSLSSFLIASEHLRSKISSEQYQLLRSTFQEIMDQHLPEVIQNKEKFIQELTLNNIPFLEVPETFKEKSLQFRDSVLQSHPKFQDAYLETPLSNDWIIGLDISQSGKTQASGKSILAGVELAIHQLNQKPFFRRHKLRAIALDNSGFPNRGLANLDSLMKNPKLIAVFAGMHSPVALKQLPIINQAQIPFLIPWAAATNIIPKNEKHYAFRLSVRDEYAGEFLIKHIPSKELGHLALVLENSPWGDSNLKSLKSALKNTQKKAQIIERFNWGADSFDGLINKLESNNIHSLIYVGNAPEGEKLIKSIAKTQSKIKVYSHWGITGGDFYQSIREVLPEIDLKFLQTFTTDLKPHDKIEPNIFSKITRENDGRIIAPVGFIHAYDLTQILGQAIQNKQSLKRKDIYEGLKSISKHQGIFKTYRDPFKELQEALDINDFQLCYYDTLGNIKAYLNE